MDDFGDDEDWDDFAGPVVVTESPIVEPETVKEIRVENDDDDFGDFGTFESSQAHENVEAADSHKIEMFHQNTRPLEGELDQMKNTEKNSPISSSVSFSSAPDPLDIDFSAEHDQFSDDSGATIFRQGTRPLENTDTHEFEGFSTTRSTDTLDASSLNPTPKTGIAFSKAWGSVDSSEAQETAEVFTHVEIVETTKTNESLEYTADEVAIVSETNAATDISAEDNDDPFAHLDSEPEALAESTSEVVAEVVQEVAAAEIPTDKDTHSPAVTGSIEEPKPSEVMSEDPFEPVAVLEPTESVPALSASELETTDISSPAAVPVVSELTNVEPADVEPAAEHAAVEPVEQHVTQPAAIEPVFVEIASVEPVAEPVQPVEQQVAEVSSHDADLDYSSPTKASSVSHTTEMVPDVFDFGPPLVVETLNTTVTATEAASSDVDTFATFTAVEQTKEQQSVENHMETSQSLPETESLAAVAEDSVVEASTEVSTKEVDETVVEPIAHVATATNDSVSGPEAEQIVDHSVVADVGSEEVSDEPAVSDEEASEPQITTQIAGELETTETADVEIAEEEMVVGTPPKGSEVKQTEAMHAATDAEAAMVVETEATTEPTEPMEPVEEDHLEHVEPSESSSRGPSRHHFTLRSAAQFEQNEVRVEEAAKAESEAIGTPSLDISAPGPSNQEELNLTLSPDATPQDVSPEFISPVSPSENTPKETFSEEISTFSPENSNLFPLNSGESDVFGELVASDGVDSSQKSAFDLSVAPEDDTKVEKESDDLFDFSVAEAKTDDSLPPTDSAVITTTATSDTLTSAVNCDIATNPVESAESVSIADLEAAPTAESPEPQELSTAASSEVQEEISTAAAASEELHSDAVLPVEEIVLGIATAAAASEEQEDEWDSFDECDSFAAAGPDSTAPAESSVTTSAAVTATAADNFAPALVEDQPQQPVALHEETAAVGVESSPVDVTEERANESAEEAQPAVSTGMFDDVVPESTPTAPAVDGNAAVDVFPAATGEDEEDWDDFEGPAAVLTTVIDAAEPVPEPGPEAGAAVTEMVPEVKVITAVFEEAAPVEAPSAADDFGFGDEDDEWDAFEAAPVAVVAPAVESATAAPAEAPTAAVTQETSTAVPVAVIAPVAATVVAEPSFDTADAFGDDDDEWDAFEGPNTSAPATTAANTTATAAPVASVVTAASTATVAKEEVFGDGADDDEWDAFEGPTTTAAVSASAVPAVTTGSATAVANTTASAASFTPSFEPSFAPTFGSTTAAAAPNNTAPKPSATFFPPAVTSLVSAKDTVWEEKSLAEVKELNELLGATAAFNNQEFNQSYLAIRKLATGIFITRAPDEYQTTVVYDAALSAAEFDKQNVSPNITPSSETVNETTSSNLLTPWVKTTLRAGLLANLPEDALSLEEYSVTKQRIELSQNRKRRVSVVLHGGVANKGTQPPSSSTANTTTTTTTTTSGLRKSTSVESTASLSAVNISSIDNGTNKTDSKVNSSSNSVTGSVVGSVVINGSVHGANAFDARSANSFDDDDDEDGFSDFSSHTTGNNSPKGNASASNSPVNTSTKGIAINKSNSNNSINNANIAPPPVVKTSSTLSSLFGFGSSTTATNNTNANTTTNNNNNNTATINNNSRNANSDKITTNTAATFNNSATATSTTATSTTSSAKVTTTTTTAAANVHLSASNQGGKYVLEKEHLTPVAYNFLMALPDLTYVLE